MALRYSRQILFSGIGENGQQKIRSTHVALVGCGALGTVGAEMLVRAGIGRLTIVDRDFVEESNLQRQGLFTEEDARRALPKAVAAQRALRAINAEVEVEGRVVDLTWENISGLCEGAAVLLDGTDNFETRYLINDYAVCRGWPWIYGACVGSYGVAFAVEPGKTPCLRCLAGSCPPPGSLETCETAGIVAPAVHAVAAFQVARLMQIVVGSPGRAPLLEVDVWKQVYRVRDVSGGRGDECPCCRSRRFEFLEGRQKDRFVALCGRNAVQVSPARDAELDFGKLVERFQQAGNVRLNEHLMRLELEGLEIALFRDGRSIIKGTDDVSRARSLYARYIGA